MLRSSVRRVNFHKLVNELSHELGYELDRMTLGTPRD
jgi:hypothetical protein